MADLSKKDNNSGKSEFYLDLLEVFSNLDGSSEQNKVPVSGVRSNQPTIIRPDTKPCASTNKQPRPAPRVPSKHHHVGSHAVGPKPSTKKKKPPPPRPAPPKITKTSSSVTRLSRVPPSYSKVLEEDIKACISAYSGPKKVHSSSFRDSSVSSSACLSQSSFNGQKSQSYGATSSVSDFIELKFPQKSKKAVNVNGIKVTSKDLKQAGATASFLNKHPKLSKHVVPEKYEKAVKVAGKTYDFREQHKNDFNTNTAHTMPMQTKDQRGNVPDLLGSIEDGVTNKDSTKLGRPVDLLTSVHDPYMQSKNNDVTMHKLKPRRPTKPTFSKKQVQPQTIDINSAWGDDASHHLLQKIKLEPFKENEIVCEELPDSPCIPEPSHPPPLLQDVEDKNIIPKVEPQVIALFNYTAMKPDEISIQAEDILTLLKDADDRFYVQNRTTKGFVPKFCVDVVFPLPSCDDLNFTSDQQASVCGNDSKDDIVVTTLYDYHGDASMGDLSFKVGDVIEVISRVNDEWLYGRIGQNTGNFPATYVDRIPSGLPPFTVRSIFTSSSFQEFIACYDFEATNQDEVSFKTGDKIIVTEKIDVNWWKGHLHRDNTKSGFFPCSYVKSCEQSKQTVKALYDFNGTSHDELTFQANDIITVLERVNDDWSIGRMGNSKGLFPCSFVKQM
ncbi:Uncharacterised protein g9017 [Pycnogonum litorale]